MKNRLCSAWRVLCGDLPIAAQTRDGSFWLDVSTSRGYNIAAALRGPDHVDCRNLKLLVTGKIRGLCGIHGLGCISRSDAVDVYSIKGALYEIAKAFSSSLAIRRAVGHWAMHAYEALDALQDNTPLDKFCSELHHMCVANTGYNRHVLLNLLKRVFFAENCAVPPSRLQEKWDECFNQSD